MCYKHNDVHSVCNHGPSLHCSLFPVRFKAEVGDSSEARWQKSPTAAELRFAPSSFHLCIANRPTPSLPITAPLDLQNENQSYGGIAYQAYFFHQLSGRDAACLSLN